MPTICTCAIVIFGNFFGWTDWLSLLSCVPWLSFFGAKGYSKLLAVDHVSSLITFLAKLARETLDRLFMRGAIVAMGGVRHLLVWAAFHGGKILWFKMRTRMRMTIFVTFDFLDECGVCEPMGLFSALNSQSQNRITNCFLNLSPCSLSLFSCWYLCRFRWLKPACG